MSFEFTESVNITIPPIALGGAELAEGISDVSFIVEIAAIHEGLTANYNFYSANELERSIETWVNPYPRPIITNHDTYSDSVGRVMAAKFAIDSNRNAIIIQAAIADPDAIQKYKDKRFLTGSVGGAAEHAVCSICGADWRVGALNGLPCNHKRGSMYGEKLCYLEMRGITWKEYSMVNIPADGNSSVLSVGQSSTIDDESAWTRAKVFAMDMEHESIVCFGESESYDILSKMKKKEAVSLYHNTRGTFLSALSVGELETDKENNVFESIEKDDDILEVSEELLNGLVTSDEDPVTSSQEEEIDDTEDQSDLAEGDTGGVDTAELTDVKDTDINNEEVMNDNIDDEIVEDESAETSIDDTDGDTSTSEGVEGNENADDDNTEEDVNEEVLETNEEAEEPLVSQQNAEIERLTEENQRLRTALKKGLAEKVVDLKISLGLCELDERVTAIEEHASRSARSLADSVSDLYRIAAQQESNVQVGDLSELFSSESGATVVKSDQRSTMTEAEDTDNDKLKADPSATLESMAVDALMGRRSW